MIQSVYGTSYIFLTTNFEVGRSFLPGCTPLGLPRSVAVHTSEFSIFPESAVRSKMEANFRFNVLGTFLGNSFVCFSVYYCATSDVRFLYERHVECIDEQQFPSSKSVIARYVVGYGVVMVGGFAIASTSECSSTRFTGTSVQLWTNKHIRRVNITFGSLLTYQRITEVLRLLTHNLPLG